MNISPDRGNYLPSEMHRHVISNDQVSQERYLAIKNAAAQLAGIPFFAGLVLQGSLAKGRDLSTGAARYSDMDLVAFIDADRLTADDWRLYKDSPGIQDFVDRYHYAARRAITELRNVDPFGEDEIIHPKTDERARLILSCDATTKVITDAVRAQLLGITGDFFGTKDKVDAATRVISKTGRYSIIGAYQRHERATRHFEKTRTGFVLASMFGFDVAGGLLEYRTAFFGELSKLPEEQAASIWREINSWIEQYERYGIIPETLRAEFPTTVADAKAYYLK